MIGEKKLLEKIERLENIACGYSPSLSRVCANLLCELKDFIKEQPKVNEWIPVEEVLPEKKGVYLVTYHPCHWDNVEFNTVCVGLDNFMGKTSWAKRKHQRVIAWQPLPDSYIKELKTNE